MHVRTQNDEKRKSVRVTSRLQLSYRKISPEKLERIREDCQAGISMYNREELAGIQVYIGAQAALSKIHDKDKDLAAFLSHLDNKLNLLLEKVDSSPSLLADLTLQRINISGQGVAFWTDEVYHSGEFVELHLIIPPDNSYMNCFAEVIDCCEDGEEEGRKIFRVSLKYVLIMEHDREALVQYNFRQQSLALQRRRLDKEG